MCLKKFFLSLLKFFLSLLWAVWDPYVYTAIFKMDNQRSPII